MRQTIVGGVLLFGALFSSRSAVAQTPAPSASPSPATPPPAIDASTSVASSGDGEPDPVAIRFTLSPEWGYRSFRNKEEGATTKRYIASGVPGAGARLELYPLAFVTRDVLKDFGIIANYSRALNFDSKDIDNADDDTVNTSWYNFGFGCRFRTLGGTNPLAVGVTAGVQQWVFDFDTSPPSRPVAFGRYTLVAVGADVRYAWGAFSVLGDGRFLLPVTVSAPGNRTPTGAKYGVNLALAAIVSFSRMFQVEARAAYTLLTYSLEPPPASAFREGTILDEYLVLSVGGTVSF